MTDVLVSVVSGQLVAIVYLALQLARTRERVARLEGRMNGEKK